MCINFGAEKSPKEGASCIDHILGGIKSLAGDIGKKEEQTLSWEGHGVSEKRMCPCIESSFLASKKNPKKNQ